MLSSLPSTNSTMTKKKNFSKNPNKKKQKSTTHPYVELIQSEITALEDKLVRK